MPAQRPIGCDRNQCFHQPGSGTYRVTVGSFTYAFLPPPFRWKAAHGGEDAGSPTVSSFTGKVNTAAKPGASICLQSRQGPYLLQRTVVKSTYNRPRKARCCGAFHLQLYCFYSVTTRVVKSRTSWLAARACPVKKRGGGQVHESRRGRPLW